MAALDRKNLVKNGKYNTSEIMRRAWAYVKNPFCTQYRNNFKAALKAAWMDAKEVMSDMKESKPFAVNPNVRPSDLYTTLNMRMGYACR